MDFRLKIIQVGKFLTSQSLTKFLDFGTHAKPATSRLTLLHGPTKTDDPNSVNLREKIESLSLSLHLFFSSRSLPSLPRFPSFLPPCLFYPSPIFISFPFSPFSFSLSFFSFSLPSLFWMTLIHRDQVGETSPHLPCCHLSTPCIFSYFHLFFFVLFIASCNTWLNVSHVFQVYHMALSMCHSIGAPYGIT